jgi:hypothetical protein
LTGLLEPRPGDVLSAESKKYFDQLVSSRFLLPPSYSAVALGKKT